MKLDRTAILRTLIWIYCLSWALDYRAEQSGGGAVQILTFGLTVASAAGIIVIGMRKLLTLPGVYILLLWMGYLVFSFVVAKYHHVVMGVYLRNSMPPLLMFFSMCITLIAAGQGLSYKHVLYPMLIASGINIIWRVVYILVVVGKPIDMVRVEILSQSMPFVLAWMFACIGLKNKIDWAAVGLGLLCLLVYVLSITRSAAIILAAEIFATGLAALACRRMRVLPPDFRAVKTRQMGVLAIGFVAVSLLVVVSAWFVIERWIERLTHPVGMDYLKEDPSKLTRLAETLAFYKIMKQNPESWVIGMGVGHPYYWDESFHTELAYTYGNLDIFRSEYREVTFPGHSIWTYAAFSGGAIGLLLHLFMFFYGLWSSWAAARAIRRIPSFPLPAAYLAFIGQLGFLSLSLTFNPFIERASCICLGVLFTFPQFLLIAAYKQRVPEM
jgi:hypothetical protein